MLERWARFSYRRKWLVIAAWVGILIGVTVASQSLAEEFSTEFSIPGSESQDAADLLKERFPAQSGEAADVVFESPSGFEDPAIQARVEAVLAAIAEVPGHVGTTSPFDRPEGFIAPGGTVARAEARFQEGAGLFDRSAIEQLFAIVDAANDDGLRVEVGGPAIAFNEEGEFGSEAIGLAGAVLILLIAFGSVVAMGVPIGAAIFGLGGGFAILGLGTTFFPIPEFAPQFAAMIGIGVGIDYSLLVVTRFREALHRGASVEDSVVEAVTTAGRAVLFAGLVVAIALSGLLTMGLPFVSALGLAGATVVVMAVLVALTLTPAVLSMAGRRVDRWRVPFLHTTEGVDPSSGWYRMSHAIQRRPLPYFVGASGLLLFLAIPFLQIELGFSDAGTSSEKLHSRRAYDLLAQGFGPGFNAPLVVVVDGDDAAGFAGRIRDAAAAAGGIAEAGPVVANETGGTAIVTLFPSTAPQDGATTGTVHHLRDVTIPAVLGAATGTNVYVAGMTASQIDIGDRISARLPYLLGAVIGLSCILLMAVFRSVVVALKAAAMNLISIGAAYGVLVAVFQWGWFAGLIGVETGPIEVFLPMFLFTILFGLSMDYEVFLVSRIREEWLKTKDNSVAVSNGLAATARVITAAAAIMVTVFMAFVLGDERVIKQFGLGLATAIFIDATIVRMVLVPSTMGLLGRANWWLPGWLDRILPDLNLEGARGDPEPVPAGGGD